MVQPVQPAHGSARVCVEAGGHSKSFSCSPAPNAREKASTVTSGRAGTWRDEVVLTKAPCFACFWGSHKCLSPLASSGIAAAVALPSSLPGARGVTAGAGICGHSKGQCQLPALVPSHALAAPGLCSSLPADAAGLERGGGLQPRTHSRVCPRDSGQNLGRKGKRKAFAFPEGKGGRARQQGQGSIQTNQQTLLLVLKMEMRSSAHPWAARGDSLPWLTGGLGLGFLAGTCGKMSWNSG